MILLFMLSGMAISESVRQGSTPFGFKVFCFLDSAGIRCTKADNLAAITAINDVPHFPHRNDLICIHSVHLDFD